MSYNIIAVLIWLILAASLLLTIVGFARHSWKALWLAAGLTLAFSVPAMFSVGALTLLLAALQIASAVAFRRSTGALGWLMLLGSAVVGWLIVVPGQLVFGPAPLLVVLIPLGILGAIIATITGSPEQTGPTP